MREYIFSGQMSKGYRIGCNGLLCHCHMIFFLLFSEETKYPDIKVCDFLNHVRALHADSDNGFSNEFEDITSQTRTDLMADASYLPENKAKNRYVNISACKFIFLSILLFMVIKVIENI